MNYSRGNGSFFEDNTVTDKDFSYIEVYKRVLGGTKPKNGPLTSEVAYMKPDLKIVFYNGRGNRNGRLYTDLNAIIQYCYPDIIHVTKYRTYKDIRLKNYKRLNLPYSPLFEVDRQALFIHNSIEDVSCMSSTSQNIHVF